MQDTGAEYVPALLFLTAPCIDFCNDQPGRPFHAPPVIHRGNTNNYTIITSPAARTERCGATVSASGSSAQLALNLWHHVFSALQWRVTTIQCLLQSQLRLSHRVQMSSVFDKFLGVEGLNPIRYHWSQNTYFTVQGSKDHESTESYADSTWFVKMPWHS